MVDSTHILAISKQFQTENFYAVHLRLSIDLQFTQIDKKPKVNLKRGWNGRSKTS